MTLTRDSWLLYLAFAGAILGYLAAAGDPRLWDFQGWIQFCLVGVTWWIGKLQNSSLPGENDPDVRAAKREGDVVLGSISGAKGDK